MLPKAENILRLANANMVVNFKKKTTAKIVLPPLIERAYMLVNETGAIPYRDYTEEEFNG
jgi:hypothetical protein